MENQKQLENSSQEFVTPEEFVAELRALCAKVPQFGQIPGAELLRISASGRVLNDPYFTAAAIGAVAASQPVQSGIGYTAEQLQQVRNDDARWVVAEQELRAALRGVASANAVRRSGAGAALLQAYALASRLAKQSQHASLLPHVAAMTSSMRFGRRPSAPGTPSTPAPTPPAPESGTDSIM